MNTKLFNRNLSGLIVLLMAISMLTLGACTSQEIQVDDQDQLTDTDEVVQEETPANDEEVMPETLSYTSERWGFSFDYPSELVLVTTYEYQYEDQGHIQLRTQAVNDEIQSGERNEGGESIQLSAYEKPAGTSLLDWARENVGIVNFSEDYQEVTINGVDYLYYNVAGMVNGTDYLTSNGDFVYSFTVLNGSQELEDWFQDVLQSISF
ncbi:hypothetical protein KKC94_00260 [Patescibacteria group bacterium]|nr:hypothetical protein [Patescibacteria group bacterium]